MCNCSKNRTQPTGFGRSGPSQQQSQRPAAQPVSAPQPSSPPPQGTN